MNFIERAISQIKQPEPGSKEALRAARPAKSAEGRALEKARKSRREIRALKDVAPVAEPGGDSMPSLTPGQIREIARAETKRRRQLEATVRAERKASNDALKYADPANDRRVKNNPRVAKLERRVSHQTGYPVAEQPTERFDTVVHSLGTQTLEEPDATSTHFLDSETLADTPSQLAEPVTRVKTPNRTSGKVRIDLSELFAEGYLGAEGKAGLLSEEFRRIKRPLLANAFGQGLPAAVNGTRIMITSALPSEGKSFCAIHLALSIASEVENNVVLVEADVAKPSVLKKLKIRQRKGLSNWFANQSMDVCDLTVATEIPGLKIVPAGKGAPDSIDMLASRAMSTFFDELERAYPDDLIIVDAPPLLPATETKVLATYMGQVVVVVEAGETPKTVVADALEMLTDIEVVGLVLNKSRHQPKNAGYGYGYGY